MAKKEIDWFRLLYDPGQWMQLPIPLVKLFGSQNATALVYFIYLCNRFNKEWVFCTVERMEEELGWTYRIQKYAIDFLEKEKIITSRQLGNPAKRFIRVNFESLKKRVAKLLEFTKMSDHKMTNLLSADSTKMASLYNTRKSNRKKDTGSRRTPKGNAMGFLPEQDSKPAHRADLDRAQTLREFVVAHYSTKAPWSRKAWAASFGVLRRRHGSDVVRKTLTWFINQEPDDKLPKIRSAKQFLKCFDWISDLMAKRQPIQIEPSKDALAIFDRIKSSGWPGKAKSQLPSAIESSLQFVKTFRDQVRKLAKRTEPKNKSNTLNGFAKYILHDLNRYDTLVENYFARLQMEIVNWDNFTGNLSNFVLSSKGERWDTMGRNWAIAYTDRTDVWEKLLKGINEDRKARRKPR